MRATSATAGSRRSKVIKRNMHIVHAVSSSVFGKSRKEAQKISSHLTETVANQGGKSKTLVSIRDNTGLALLIPKDQRLFGSKL